MINKFRSLFTGYRVSKVVLNGLDIKTYYRGNRPSSDPLVILRELKLKLGQIQPAADVTMDFSKCWDEKMACLDGLSPSFTAKFQSEDSDYSISRFVTKQNKSPLSHYTFSKDERIFAFFSRIYDHGDFFKELEKDLFENYDFSKVDTGNNCHFITNRKYSALVDIFGHSQSFFWNDKEALEKCLAAIN